MSIIETLNNIRNNPVETIEQLRNMVYFHKVTVWDLLKIRRVKTITVLDLYCNEITTTSKAFITQFPHLLNEHIADSIYYTSDSHLYVVIANINKVC